MRLRWLLGINAIVIALTFMATGCGEMNSNYQRTGGGQEDAAGNPPFQKRLDVEVSTLDKKYDPHVADASDFTSIQAVNQQGQIVTLNALTHPIMFVAYWCPHCQRTLVMLTKNQDKLGQLPVIVSVGFRPGTTFSEAKKLTDTEHQALGLSNKFTVDYDLHVDYKKLIPFGFPTMVYSNGTSVKMLYAEHTLAVWQHALAVAK